MPATVACIRRYRHRRKGQDLSTWLLEMFFTAFDTFHIKLPVNQPNCSAQVVILPNTFNYIQGLKCLQLIWGGKKGCRACQLVRSALTLHNEIIWRCHRKEKEARLCATVFFQLSLCVSSSSIETSCLSSYGIGGLITSLTWCTAESGNG